MTLQTTLARESVLEGTGLHSGKRSYIRLLPSDANTGITFQVEVGGSAVRIPALHSHLFGSSFRTSLCGGGKSIDTVEHILAAFYAHGIDNAVIELEGPEIPAVDGSSLPWSMMLLDAGITLLDSPRRYMEIRKKITVSDHQNQSWCSIEPSEGFRVVYHLDYPHPLIGQQSFESDISVSSFITDIAAARTFGFIKDIGMLESMGLARGAGLDNTLVFDDLGVMNPGGMRWSNEPVRHKVLDVVGDLSLIGLPLIGRFQGYKSGHRLNQSLVSAVINDIGAWKIIS